MKRISVVKVKMLVTLGIIFFITIAVGVFFHTDTGRVLLKRKWIDLGNIVSSQSGASLFSNYLKSSAASDSYTADATNYRSDSKTISIKKTVTGREINQITYYVADVKLANSTDLKSASAKDSLDILDIDMAEYVSVIAENNKALLAVNGDYYALRENGVIIRNGLLYRDEPAREGLAIYADGSMRVYDENKIPAKQLLEDGVWNTLSFGPPLLENGEISPDIGQTEDDASLPLQGKQSRTGIGVTDTNHFLFVVVDKSTSEGTNGATLLEFANIFKDLGCTTAYHIYFGPSVEMYFMGNVVNQPFGTPEERKTGDILYIP